MKAPRTSEQIADDYREFRGQCLPLCKALIAGDASLRLVRGHYFCPVWHSAEPHWWCEKPDGTVVDPSCRQFPSNGRGCYEEFNGVVECSNCGKRMLEAEADFESNYAFCSDVCHMRFVGL